MRITNSAPLNSPEIQKPGAHVPPSRPSDAGSTANADEVALSPAGESALSNRSERVAQLHALVNSSNYAPSSIEVSKKLVADALSRPADQG